MKFLEKDLEEIIYEASNQQLTENGFPNGIRKRQLKIGNYGIADLVFFERVKFTDVDYINQTTKITDYGLCITVCELKKDKIGISAFLQAIRYCKGISDYLETRAFDNYYFEIILLGNGVDDSGSFVYISDLLSIDESTHYNGINNDDLNFTSNTFFNKKVKRIHFKNYSYGFNGIEFKSIQGYSLIKKGFK